MLMEHGNRSVSKESKGTWMRCLSVFLCVMLFMQDIAMPVHAAGKVQDAGSGTALPIGSVSDNSNVYANGGAEAPDASEEEQADSVEQASPEPQPLLSEETDSYGETEEDIVLPELRYDFCEIDDSVIAERSIEKEALASSYLSPEATAVSENSVSYNPIFNLPQLLSPVRNQNPTDTCWAFSTAGVMELSAIRIGLRTAEQSYSPYHMAYFLYHHVTDPLGGTAGDSNTAVSGSEPLFLNAGGNLFMALFQAANWIGPVDEQLAPFDSLKETGEPLADSLSYENDGVLKNGYMLSTGDNMTMEIKQAVVSCGGVAVMFNAGSEYRNSATSAFYCDKTGTNHAVIVVGWDDDYATENFLESHRPDQPGAWIVKNSWGTGSGIGGYYYLSYEDKSIAFPMAVEMMQSGTYENNYHYDGSLAATAASIASVKSGGSIGNIFTAHASARHYDESLEAVSLAVQSTDVSYELMIYKNLEADEPDSLYPDSGTLAHRQSGVLGMAGIYTIPLTEPVVLEGGECFSVVFRLYSQDQSDVCVWTEKDYNYGWCKGNANIQKGQSFRKYGSNYTWFDLYNTNQETNTFRNLARIKAFTNTLDTMQAGDITKYFYSISENSYMADGTAKCPEVTLTNGDRQLICGQDYKVEYKDNVQDGIAQAIVTGLSPYYGSITIPFYIYAFSQEDCPEHSFEGNRCINCGMELMDQTLTLDAGEGTALLSGGTEADYSIKKTYLDEPFTLAVTGNYGSVTFASDDTQVLQVGSDGTVTIAGAGTARITVKAAQTQQYAEAKLTVLVTADRARLGRAELSETSFYYDKTAKTPTASVYDQKGNRLLEFRDYALSYADNIRTGTASVRIIGTGNYSGELTKQFVIVRRPQDTCSHVYENGSCVYCGYTKQMQLLKGTVSYEKKYSAGVFRLDTYTTGDGALTYASDDSGVATVDGKGNVTIRGIGSCYITVRAAETNRYYSGSTQVLLEVIQGTATITPSVTSITKTYGSKAFSLGMKTNSDGKLTYKSSDTKIASVSAKGKVTIKKYGKVTLTVTSAETEKYAKKTRKITLNIVPKKAAIKKLTAAGSRKVTVKVKKDSTVTGYQLQLSTDPKFKKNVKTRKLTSPSEVTASFAKLKKGSTVYCRVRSYKTVSGVKYYGEYSAAKKVKVK